MDNLIVDLRAWQADEHNVYMRQSQDGIRLNRSMYKKLVECFDYFRHALFHVANQVIYMNDAKS